MIEIKREELWEPWYVGERPYPNARMEKYDIPEELVERFQAAKAEMEGVWYELRQIMVED